MDKPDKQSDAPMTVKVQLLKGYPVPTSFSEYLAQLAHHYETYKTPPEYLTITTDRPNLMGTLGAIKKDDQVP